MIKAPDTVSVLYKWLVIFFLRLLKIQNMNYSTRLQLNYNPSYGPYGIGSNPTITGYNRRGHNRGDPIVTGSILYPKQEAAKTVREANQRIDAWKCSPCDPICHGVHNEQDVVKMHNCRTLNMDRMENIQHDRNCSEYYHDPLQYEAHGCLEK